MHPADLQKDVRPRWTIGRLMIVIAMIGLVFGLARAIGWWLVPPLVVLVFGLATVFGIHRDRRSGGIGILGAVLGGIVAGIGCVSLVGALIVISEPGSIDLGEFLVVVLLYGVGLGGIFGLIAGGLVAIAHILSGIDSGIRSLSTTIAHSIQQSRSMGPETKHHHEHPGPEQTTLTSP